MHRQHVHEEVMEMLPIMVRFVCLQTTPGPLLNKPMVDEFHTAQIRSLSFLAYIAKSVQIRVAHFVNIKAF